MADNCGNCRFYLEVPPGGRCRRYPRSRPKRADWWCGEHRRHRGVKPVALVLGILERLGLTGQRTDD